MKNQLLIATLFLTSSISVNANETVNTPEQSEEQVSNQTVVENTITLNTEVTDLIVYLEQIIICTINPKDCK
jgi:hypothetical protein